MTTSPSFAVLWQDCWGLVTSVYWEHVMAWLPIFLLFHHFRHCKGVAIGPMSIWKLLKNPHRKKYVLKHLQNLRWQNPGFSFYSNLYLHKSIWVKQPFEAVAVVWQLSRKLCKFPADLLYFTVIMRSLRKLLPNCQANYLTYTILRREQENYSGIVSQCYLATFIRTLPY